MNKFTLSLYLAVFITLGVRLYLFFTTPKSFTEGDKIRITSRILSEPLRFEKSQYIRLEGLKVYLPLYPEIGYGDRVVVEGVVEEGSLKQPSLVELNKRDNVLFALREHLISVYTKALPPPHSSLVAGMTIGSKQNISREFWEALKVSGTAHVVVASGMNVTLVAKFIITIAVLFFRRKWAIVIALIGVWSYSLISGFDAPIIRASIMGSIAFIAQELGRLSSALRALFITAIIMLLINPLWVTDLGFILSFVSTLALVLFEARVRRFLTFVPKIIKEDLSTSVAAQIGVAPILYFIFGTFSPLSPLINAAVLWTVVPITIIGMIGGLIGVVSVPLGRLVLLLVYPLTGWFSLVVNLVN